MSPSAIAEHRSALLHELVEIDNQLAAARRPREAAALASRRGALEEELARVFDGTDAGRSFHRTAERRHQSKRP